jgi:hypothetical protein
MRFKEAHKIYGLNIGADNTNHEATVMKVKQKVAWHVDAKPHYP